LVLRHWCVDVCVFVSVCVKTVGCLTIKKQKHKQNKKTNPTKQKKNQTNQ